MKLSKEGTLNKKQKSVQERNNSNIVVQTHLENSFDTRWSEIKIEGKNIASRSNHAATIFGTRLFVHGGYDADKGVLSDFHCIDLSGGVEQFKWQKLSSDCNGELIKLKCHTSVTYKDCLYLFGGEKSSNLSNDSVYIFDIPRQKWTKIQPNIAVPKVDSHATVIVDTKMYVYGGYVPDQAAYMNEIYAFDLEKHTWEIINRLEKGQDRPEGRSDFDMVEFQKSLWIFGGSNGEKTLDDLWKFDLQTKKWTQIQSKDTPESRRGHSMLTFENYIFMFGGIQDVTKEKNDVYIYQPQKNSWNKIHTTTNSIYDCSPTLKKQRKQNSPNKFEIMKVELTKEEKQTDPMQKILNQNKQKKFNERKKELLKQFSEKPGEFKKKRSFSPTTESMLKTLEAIGSQEQTKNELKQEIIYDESHRFIIGKKPCARDGQSVNLLEKNMYIFGGDRHLMTFNDLYCFDLQKGVKSLLLYNEK